MSGRKNQGRDRRRSLSSLGFGFLHREGFEEGFGLGSGEMGGDLVGEKSEGEWRGFEERAGVEVSL